MLRPQDLLKLLSVVIDDIELKSVDKKLLLDMVAVDNRAELKARLKWTRCVCVCGWGDEGVGGQD